jgi:RNA polymerase sigma factor (TIGR02999 family)
VNVPLSVLPAVLRSGAHSAEQLLPLLYEELRSLAARKMSVEDKSFTLQPTALVHEAWLRLGGEHQPRWENHAHFLGAAAEAMRRILIERARKRQAVRHGGALKRVTDDLDQIVTLTDDAHLLRLNEALDKFSQAHPEKAELVNLRYFAGLKIEVVAQTMKISERTAKRWWSYAQAWLHREIVAEGAGSAGIETSASP